MEVVRCFEFISQI